VLSAEIKQWSDICLTLQVLLTQLTPVFAHQFSNSLEYRMFEETLARLRTHHKNVQRYRQLLETNLTDFEREYIGKRLSEEQTAIDVLSANAQTEAPSRSATNLSDGNPQAPCATGAAKHLAI
jgi:hypothetical protein